MLKDINVVKEEILKTGTNNGRAWTLYKYTCEDDFTFTTFNQHPMGLTKIDVEERPNGKFMNFAEVNRKPDPKHDAIMAEFAKLNKRIDGLADWLKQR